MNNIKVIGWVIFALFFSAFSLDAETVESDLPQIKNELKSAGITDFEIQINLRIIVPESENPYIADSSYADDEKDASLWATVIVPNRVKSDGPQPSVLLTTAYKKGILGVTAAPLIKHGYNVVLVDMRGTGTSEGHWNMLDLIEAYDVKYIIDKWIPSQSWANGDVGMVGGSYMGILQMLAGGLIDTDKNGKPLHLKACVPQVPLSDVYSDIGVHGGTFNLEFMSFWIILTETLNILPRFCLFGEDGVIPDTFSLSHDEEYYQEAIDEFIASLRQFPEPIYDLVINSDNDIRGDMLTRRSPFIYWPDKPEGGWNVGLPEREEGKKVFPEKLPVLMTGGWFDIFTRGTLLEYSHGLKNHSVSDKGLIVGDWYHLEAATGLGVNALLSMDLQARWFDWKIRGKQDPFMKEFPVIIRVMGDDRWRAEKDWPLPESRTENMTFYLSKESADKIEGDWFTENDKGTHLLYSLTGNNSRLGLDENDPVMIHKSRIDGLHGTNSRSSARWLMGMPALFSTISKAYFGIDNSADKFYEDENSDDWKIPTFTTEPLENDLEITGPLTLRFWASTEFEEPGLFTSFYQNTIIDALKRIFKIKPESQIIDRCLKSKDVQWVAELNDVFEDGRSRNITSGWLRASHRQRDPDESENTPEHGVDPSYVPFDPFYFGPSKNPEYIKEGDLYEYVVELWPTCNVFKKGHRIRVTLTGSDWPHLMPILIGSRNTIVIDKNHEARLDFKTVNKKDEGRTWKWIGPASVSMDKDGFFSKYLLNHSDRINVEENNPAEDGNGTSMHSQNETAESLSVAGGCMQTANPGLISCPAPSGRGLAGIIILMLFPLILLFIHRKIRGYRVGRNY